MMMIICTWTYARAILPWAADLCTDQVALSRKLSLQLQIIH